MKKIITILMAAIMLVTTIPTVYAIENEAELQIVYLNSYSEVPVDNMCTNTVYIFPNETPSNGVLAENYNLKGNITRDANAPTEVWNIALKGRYDFAGSSTSTELYTLYRFYGEVDYLVYVSNLKLLTKQKVNVYDAYGTVLTTFNVPANSSATYIVEPDHKAWYLGFPNDSNVEGYVDKYDVQE